MTYLKFTAPASWKQRGRDRDEQSDFAIVDGQQQARVSFIDFRASKADDCRSSVDISLARRSGLEPIQKDALPVLSESIQIDGKARHVHRDDSQSGQPDKRKALQATLARST